MEKEAVLEYLESRLRDNPKSLLFARLADVYLEQGKINDGMSLCTEGVKHHPYYSSGYFVLAKAHVLNKEYDKAESALKKVLSHDQQYLAAQKMLADIMVKTGWEATAVEHYAAVLEIDPFQEKIRDLMKRYASKPAPKTPLLEPSEDPAAAAEEEFPAVESKSPPSKPDEPRTEVAAETPPPFKPEMDFQTLPDWTDSIREFLPADGNPPPIDGDPERPAGAESNQTALPDEDLFEPPKSRPDAVEESQPLAESKPESSREKLVDFTQDWFDLSSFETIEKEIPKDAQPVQPPLKIVEAGPSPAEVAPAEVPPVGAVPAEAAPVESLSGPLFEKDEPKEILTPADLFSATPEEPPPIPPVRMKPAVAPESVPPRKTAEFKPPHEAEPKAPEEPQPRVVKEPPTPPKTEDKPELKIVTSTLGEIYAVQGQFDKAIQVYEALLEKIPGEQKYLDKIADLKKKLREASGK